MAFARRLAWVLVVAIAAAGFCGCQKKEGPAEKAGRKMDEAVKSLKDTLDKATSK